MLLYIREVYTYYTHTLKPLSSLALLPGFYYPKIRGEQRQNKRQTKTDNSKIWISFKTQYYVEIVTQK